MPKTKRNSKEKWNHPNYRHCYAYNRDGVVYFSINTKRMVCKPSIPFTTANKHLALQYLDLYIQKHLDGVIEQPKTLFDLLEEYHNTQFKTLKSNSQLQKKYILNKYITKDYLLKDLLKFKVELITRLETLNINNQTKNNILILIRSVLNFGIKIGWLKENIFVNIRYKNTTKNEVNYTFEDLDLLINTLSTKQENIKRLLKFIRYSGCRIAEAVNLKTENLLEDRIEIFGKGDRTRYIMNAYIDEYDYIFPNRQVLWDSGIITIKTDLKIYCKKQGFKWSGFHAIRKLRESELIDKYKLPDNLVAEMFGHSLEVQAKVYRQKRSEKDKKEFAELYKTSNL